MLANPRGQTFPKLYGFARHYMALIGCIVTDVRMPGMSGLELRRQLSIRKIDLPVIVMTGHGDVPLAVEAMKAGAIDFIEKPFRDDVLISAIQVAMNRAAKDSRRDDAATATQTRLKALSPREAEVLEGLVAGLPNKTIAYELKIGARTAPNMVFRPKRSQIAF